MNAKELLLDIGRTSGANVTNQVAELQKKHISTVAELVVKLDSDVDIITAAQLKEKREEELKKGKSEEELKSDVKIKKLMAQLEGKNIQEL